MQQNSLKYFSRPTREYLNAQSHAVAGVDEWKIEGDDILQERIKKHKKPRKVNQDSDMLHDLVDDLNINR